VIIFSRWIELSGSNELWELYKINASFSSTHFGRTQSQSHNGKQWSQVVRMKLRNQIGCGDFLECQSEREYSFRYREKCYSHSLEEWICIKVLSEMALSMSLSFQENNNIQLYLYTFLLDSAHSQVYKLNSFSIPNHHYFIPQLSNTFFSLHITYTNLLFPHRNNFTHFKLC